MLWPSSRYCLTTESDPFSAASDKSVLDQLCCKFLSASRLKNSIIIGFSPRYSASCHAVRPSWSLQSVLTLRSSSCLTAPGQLFLTAHSRGVIPSLSLASALAPWLRRASTTASFAYNVSHSRWCALTAIDNGVVPWLSLTLISALCSSSRSTMAALKACAANNKGVDPLSSLASMLAFRSSRNSTMPLWPSVAADDNGVKSCERMHVENPLLDSMLRPLLSSKNLITLMSPFLAASWQMAASKERFVVIVAPFMSSRLKLPQKNIGPLSCIIYARNITDWPA